MIRRQPIKIQNPLFIINEKHLPEQNNAKQEINETDTTETITFSYDSLVSLFLLVSSLALPFRPFVET